MYQQFGQLHAAAISTITTMRRGEGGQGTVEYVALILLLALVFAAVVKLGTKGDFGIGQTIVEKLKGSIDGVGDPPTKGGR